MKTAVSIPSPIFAAGERLARRLRVPRSRLYALALTEYINRHGDARVTEALNASLERSPMQADPVVREAARRTLANSEW